MKDIMSVKGLAFQTYRSISQICTERSQFIRQDEIELLSRLICKLALRNRLHRNAGRLLYSI